MATELLEEPKSVPFTIRIDEDLIEKTKQKARKLSYELQKDISHTDLIRQYLIDGIHGKESLEDRPEWLNYAGYNTRFFWTESRRKEFLATDIAKNINDAIENEDWSYPVQLAREIFEYAMDNLGISRKVMLVDKEPQPKPWVYERQARSIAWVRNRRGNVPEQIFEQESIMVPSFEVVSNPELNNSECQTILLFELIAEGVMSVVREIDTNVINALDAAAESRAHSLNGGGLGYHPADPKQYETTTYGGSQIIEVHGGSFCPSHITEALQKIAQHSLEAECMLVRPDDYVKFHEWGKDYLNAPPLKEALKTKNYGDIMGTEILVSDRIPEDHLYILSGQEKLGVLINKQKLHVEPKSNPSKMRKGIVFSSEIGIVIFNDYAVSMVKKNVNSQVEDQT